MHSPQHERVLPSSGCDNEDVSTRTWGWLAAVVDIVLIVLFALIGRSSHGEANTAWALWTTAYPFLAGWAIGYVSSGAWAARSRSGRRVSSSGS